MEIKFNTNKSYIPKHFDQKFRANNDIFEQNTELPTDFRQISSNAFDFNKNYIREDSGYNNTIPNNHVQDSHRNDCLNIKKISYQDKIKLSPLLSKRSIADNLIVANNKKKIISNKIYPNTLIVQNFTKKLGKKLTHKLGNNSDNQTDSSYYDIMNYTTVRNPPPEMNILRKNNKDLRKTKDEILKENNTLLNKLKKLQISNIHLNNENTNLKLKISELKSNYDIDKNIIENKLKQKINAIDGLKEENLTLQELLQAKENEIQKMKNNLGQKKKFESIKELKEEEFSSEIKCCDNIKMNDLEHFVTESNSLKKENINKNNLINELRQENNKLKNIISKLKNELNKKSQTSLMDHPQTRNESIKYSKSTKDNYKINNNYMNEGNSSFSEVVKLKETIKKFQSQIKNNNKIYTEKDAKLNYMKNDSEYKTNEIKDLTEKYKQLYNEFDIKQKENIELTKKMNKSNEQKKGLQKKITDLERENSEYQQQNYELKNQINKLQIRVNSVHSGSINLFGRKDKYQDLEQQIQQLQTKNEELEEKIRGLKQCNENGEKIEKIIEENRKLKKENLDLNNEILTYKNLINENDKENELSNNDNDNDIEDDKNNVNIKKNILENIKAEYGLSEIKNSTVDSNILGSILKKKSKEDNLLSSNMKASDIYDELDRVKKENSEKDEKIKQLEKEIQKYKWMNNNLVKEKNNLMKKISFFENKTGNKDEELNTYTTKNINRNKVINLKDDSMNKSRNQSNIQGGGDKVQIYKQQIVEYKNMNESDQKQMKTLKTDIKKLNEKLQNMNTFGGQVPNFGEFIQLIYKVFAGFKPKKKEQKDAYEKLLAILKNPIF